MGHHSPGVIGSVRRLARKGWSADAIARLYRMTRADVRAMLEPPARKRPARPRPSRPPRPRLFGIDREWAPDRGAEYRDDDAASMIMPAIAAAELGEPARAEDLSAEDLVPPVSGIPPATSAEEWGSFHATAGRGREWRDD